ncbi:DUF6443 domain-containing protein, partial [Rubrolithibacter danxiaensis]|uniref:DUF6443 domain-containing protein n=1 Tax=Rubrolithibacter danxiaensis TaxID=3390805 RepID=UPI003BF8D3ED
MIRIPVLNYLVALLSVVCYTTAGYGQSQDKNYVLTRSLRVAVKSSAELNAASGDKNKVQMEVQYIDGLGRPVQSIQVQGSPLGKDIVTPVEYDSFGREARKYLPYADDSNGYGLYKPNAVSSQQGFYSQTGPVVHIPSSGVSFSEARFEASPLNRVLEQGFPGTSWKIGGGHTVETEYGTNVSTDPIKLWTVVAGGAQSSTYANNELYLTKVTDENEHSSFEYKDKEGQVVCKKVQNGNTYLYTYYVYDDLGNLSYVVPPLPSEAGSLPAAFSENDAVFKNFFYGYHYDGRNRMVEKKIPGKEWEHIVYNVLDKPVLTQDGKQRGSNTWLFTKYDAFGRVVYTGELTDTRSRDALQTSLNNLPAGTPLWETFTNSSTDNGYSSVSFPQIYNKALTVNYYDDYSFLSNSAINPSTAIYKAPAASVDTLLQIPRGLLTGSKVNVLGTTNYLFSLNHYDTEGRMVQSYSQHYQGGSIAAGKYDAISNQYSFTGALTKSKRNHFAPGSSPSGLNVVTAYGYDHAGRKMFLQQQYSNTAVVSPVLDLARYEYNELGQLVKKSLNSKAQEIALGEADAIEAGKQLNLDAAKSITLGPGFFIEEGAVVDMTISPSGPYLQVIDYRYNSRGWLNRINNPDNLEDETDASLTDAFAERLEYDQSVNGALAQYNGNISSLNWQTRLRTQVGQEPKGYAFEYDPLNRLTASFYKAASGNDKFNETLSYDELGNIESLIRKDASGTLNSLSYDYGSGINRSNKLLSVADIGTEQYSSSYGYDINGNVTSDSKKGISANGIIYNILNLPSEITLSNKTIDYVYDASGRKLQRKTSSGEDRSYVNGIEYAGNTLEFIQNEEGRGYFSADSYILEYNLVDHLGNVRALIGDKNKNGNFDYADEVLQVNDYYGFGREIAGAGNINPTPDNKYKYNGKEFQ